MQVNQKLCDIVGYARTDLLMHTFQDITFPADLEADLAYVQQLLAGERQTYAMEKRYLRVSGRNARSSPRNGVSLLVESRQVLVRTASGQPEAILEINRDITEREHLREEREEARARALAAKVLSQQMDTFLGIVSHELKTPLTTIKATLQLVARQLMCIHFTRRSCVLLPSADLIVTDS